jgi:RNA polymerase sigma-70 factor (sigma-E family)
VTTVDGRTHVAEPQPGPVAVTPAPDPLAQLVSAHWTELVRTAALLLRDASAAEDVVADAVVACLRRGDRLTDPEQALAYVRKAVLNTGRSALRRRRVAWAHRPPATPDAPGADEGALARLERDAVVGALRRLPRRQREAVVLRFYADATEKQAAAAMGCSVGAVKAYTSRGLASLHTTLGELA